MALVVLIVTVILLASSYAGSPRYNPGNAGVIAMLCLLILVFLLFNLIVISP
jgi:hypothetical protein